MNRKTPIDRYALHERLSGCFTGEPKATTLRGGRTEALRLLDAYDPAGYGRGRNFLAGPVSKLSPYIRYGMISLWKCAIALANGLPTILAALRSFSVSWHGATTLPKCRLGTAAALRKPSNNPSTTLLAIHAYRST